MTVATMRRLPGFAFEPQVPVYDDVLPRMDVAVFVGIAASGPLHLPVPIEDAEQFGVVFGVDAPLAWDADAGRVAQAQLAPAVRAFFANGGRRCWVIRVAGKTVPNTFGVPGVAMVSGAELETFRQLTLAARSAGSWSDAVAVASSLTVQRFGVLEWDPEDYAIDLIASSGTALEVGDLLRLTWRDSGVQLFLTVASVEALDAGLKGRRRTQLHVQGGLPEEGSARWFDLGRVPMQEHGTALGASGTFTARFHSSASSPPSMDDEVTIELDADPSRAPQPGEVLVVKFGADTLLFTVGDIVIEGDGGSPGGTVIRARGRGLWPRQQPFDSESIESPHDPAMSQAPAVERIALDVWTKVGAERPQPISGLGLAPGHRRHVCQLPTDDVVFGMTDWADREVWGDVVAPRLPLAGSGGSPLCIPFGVTAMPVHYQSAPPSSDAPLVRDGLVPFDVALFADTAFLGTRSTTLVDDAEYLRFLAPVPRTLRGLHAAIQIEEATLIAIPDVGQRGWEQGAPVRPDVTVLDSDRACVDDGRFEECRALECGPRLTADSGSGGDVVLSWTHDDQGPFEVQRATSAEWADATTIFAGPGHSTTVTETVAGQFYYRVRGLGLRWTEWSNGIASRVTAVGGWRMTSTRRYRDDVLVAVHRLLLRLCAARRDLLAVLSLPAHFTEDDSASHVRVLAPAVHLVDRELPTDGTVEPLSAGESDALSFAAAYHGWSYQRDTDGTLRTMPPDGPVCGVIARRSIERGAWVAPANEELRGLVGLVRPVPPSRWQELQALQLNVLRQGPQGCVVMSADTLALDDDLRPIGVRRLLILLRRLAARLGPTYVFEPNSSAFRRMVQRGFEERLGDLFQRGAFAGPTAATGFQVVTGESLNTPQSVAQGRFYVELRVAPSRPMVFVTLRLVQSGDRVSVTGG